MIDINSVIWDNWKITRKIGNGASGTVYEIEKMQEQVTISAALKMVKVPQDPSVADSLYSDGQNESSVTSYFQSIVDELTEEIKLLISVKGFPNIVYCEDFKVIKNPEIAQWDIMIRMELLQPFQEYRKQNELRESDVYRLAKDMLSALELLESKSIIHRDIKPENIFVNSYGTFKLGDFGIARILDKTSGTLSKKGSVFYIAPEVYRGRNYDQTVDIYSLGLVLYKLLNNNCLPFLPQGKPATAMEEQQALVDRMNGKKMIPAPALSSPEFGNIILKMCCFYPEDRYQTAREVLDDLEKIKPSDQILSFYHSEEKKSEENLSEESVNYNLTRKLMADHPQKRLETKKTEEPETEGDSGDKSKETENKKISEEGAELSGDSKKKEKSDQDKQPEKNTKDEKHNQLPDKPDKKKVIWFFSCLTILLVILFSYISSLRFSLNVIDGNGSGEYKAGTQVTVLAEKKTGSSFRKWEVSGLELSESDLHSEQIRIKMPWKSVKMAALYDIDKYQLIVHGGSGSGEYSLNDEVILKAEEPKAGYQFKEWTVNNGSLSAIDLTKNSLNFTMPDNDLEIAAQYEEIQYQLTVNNGYGGGEFSLGEQVSISADPMKDGMAFTYWTLDRGTLELSDFSVNNISFSMPSEDITLTAHYILQKYTVQVEGGYGSGMYSPGDKVTVTADETDSQNGMFSSWSVVKGEWSPGDAELLKKELTFAMPQENITLQANYISTSETVVTEVPASDPEYPLESEQVEKSFLLTVNGGTGSGYYSAGEQISIAHDSTGGGTSFSYWVIMEAGSEVKFQYTEVINYIMPECDVVISAVFS